MKEIAEQDLRFSFSYAIRQVPFTVRGKYLEQDQAEVIAKAIIAHMKLCHWHVMHEPMPWHSVNYGTSNNDP